MTVGDLVERIRSGQDVQRAEADLYGLLSGALLERLRAKIPPRLRSRLDAEDVLHEAFLRALAALDRFQPKGENSFYAWVYQIAKNLIIDTNKRRSVAAVRFASGETGSGPRVSQIAPRRERSVDTQIQRHEWIETLLTKLNPKEAEIIRLRSIQGLTFDEIAASWKKTPGAVQRFYSRAWHRFCALAQERGE